MRNDPVLGLSSFFDCETETWILMSVVDVFHHIDFSFLPCFPVSFRLYGFELLSCGGVRCVGSFDG